MAIGYVLAGLSLVQGVQAGKREREAARLQARREAIRNRQERVKALAESRVVRAQQMALGQVKGGSLEDSGLLGATGSFQTQTATNIGNQRVQEGIMGRQRSLLQSARNYQSRAGIFRNFASAASLAEGGSGDPYKDLGKLFADMAGEG